MAALVRSAFSRSVGVYPRRYTGRAAHEGRRYTKTGFALVDLRTARRKPADRLVKDKSGR